MNRTLGPLVLAAALQAVITPVNAQQPVVGKADDAKTKVSMCVGCHSIPGYRTAFPVVYHVPKIAGQSADYLAASLNAYKTGERWHPTMQGIARSLSEKDIADLAAYYAAATGGASR